jgi:hypothetical protein
MTITLDRQEAIEILEDIARNAQNAAARIAAIKQLEEMRREEAPSSGPFERLYRTKPGPTPRQKRALPSPRPS